VRNHCASEYYVNRNMIGGRGGGTIRRRRLVGDRTEGRRPRYLHRFALERVYTVNTAAAGGNASLLAEIE